MAKKKKASARKCSINVLDNKFAVPNSYKEILASISSKIKAAQTRAMSAINHELIEVYRDIGKIIYEQQKEG